MGKRLCPDGFRFSLMVASASLLIACPLAWLQPVVIAGGALLGLAWLRTKVEAHKSGEIFSGKLLLSRRLAATSLALFAVLLGVSLFWHGGGVLVNTFARFYRTGSLVFGGGHVVLPLLQAETVKSGLVSHDVFLAGYGAAQALPGPLFTFAAFLGASIPSAYPPWILGLWCLSAILLPSLLLILGMLPFWARLTDNVQAQAALKGANAAVVGLLGAVLYHPILTSLSAGPSGIGIALAAYALVAVWMFPPWIVVLASGLLGAAAGAFG